MSPIHFRERIKNSVTLKMEASTSSETSSYYTPQKREVLINLLPLVARLITHAAVPPFLFDLYQYTAYVMITSLFIGFQGLFATLVCVACSQFEKLRANICLIGDRRLNTAQGSGDGPGSEGMLEELNVCIRHHQNIILYIQELEKSLNPSLGGLFLFLLAALCFIAFSAVTSWGDHTDVSQAVFMYGLMMGNVSVFCWLGTTLSDQAEAVGEAAWDSSWVGSALPFQRCLIFIIALANKGFTLTAGKFVPVSNKTMMNMMNQTMSFFMFLLHMRDKNTGVTHTL